MVLWFYKVVTKNWRHCKNKKKRGQKEETQKQWVNQRLVSRFPNIFRFQLQQLWCKQRPLVLRLNFPENLLSVEHVGDEDPTGRSHEVLGEVLGVGLAVGHSPTEGEVLFEHFVAHVHEDGVHTWSEAKARVIIDKFKTDQVLIEICTNTWPQRLN